MAGTNTISDRKAMGGNTVRRVHFDWLSDAAGAVDTTLTPDVVNGDILMAVFIPDAAGTQPTNLYDVTLLDTDGADVLLGAGANLSNAAQAASAAVGCATSVLQLVVANAGNAKGGVVIIYVR